ESVNNDTHTYGCYSRRDLLRQLFVLWLPLANGVAVPFLTGSEEQRTAPAAPAGTDLSQQDDQLLDELERANFRYFWEQGDPHTGLIKDRHNVRTADNRVVASIAATGFGLTALCIAQKRSFISLPEARQRVLATLRFLW